MQKIIRYLLNSAADATGGGQPETPAAPVAPAAPPPVATIAVNGSRSEREIELEEELAAVRARAEEEAAARKRVEVEHATLADENHRLKSIGLKPDPAPKTRRFIPGTLFEEEV